MLQLQDNNVFVSCKNRGETKHERIYKQVIDMKCILCTDFFEEVCFMCGVNFSQSRVRAPPHIPL